MLVCLIVCVCFISFHFMYVLVFCFVRGLFRPVAICFVMYFFVCSSVHHLYVYVYSFRYLFMTLLSSLCI